MFFASPCTTASVTLTSGCSDVPDLSAYLRAYAHILVTFASDGSAIEASCGQRFADRRAPEPCEGAPTGNNTTSAGGQRLVDLRGIEAGEARLADENDGQRRQAQRHQLLAGARVAADVALGERHTFLRQILCRAVTGPSADVR